MKRGLLLIALLVGFSASYAQDQENMVENGSFETISGKKLKKRGQFESVEGWISPTGAKADIYSKDAPSDSPIAVPDNELGNEEPFDGENYAGIVAYSYGAKEPRSYLSTKLVEPLRKGLKYCVRFHVSLAESSKYACSDLAAHFTKRQLQMDDERTIVEDAPHVVDANRVIYDATYGYDIICGVYEAEGGEKFINIGNFTPDNEVKQAKNRVKTRGTQMVAAYYYVDLVSVTLIEDYSECECKAAEDERADPKVYQKQCMEPADGTTASEIVENSTVYFGYGKKELMQIGLSCLDNVYNVLKSNPSAKLMLYGHSDWGEEETAVNDASFSGLSASRIVAVRKYLIDKGIDGSRLQFEDKKDTDPVEDLGDGMVRAKSRRVDMKLVK